MSDRRAGRVKVLVACEFSGIVRDAFLRRGFDAFSCDLLPTEIPGPHLQEDVFTAIGHRGPWDVLIAFPPCTHLAVSGARWFSKKQREQRAAVKFFMRLANADVPRIAIENPIGIMSNRWRKPDQIIQPWQFGHGETKATCLWLKNLPVLKPTLIVPGRYGRVWREPPGPDRSKNRSRTYQGIADAMAEQWGEALLGVYP